LYTHLSRDEIQQLKPGPVCVWRKKPSGFTLQGGGSCTEGRENDGHMG